jgi:amino acid adenylation domain-containing protein
LLVQEFLENSASRFPDKIALICDHRRITYAEMNAKANCFAAYLIQQGIQRGDRVAIHLQNSEETVISIFGTLKAGAVFVVLNSTVKPDKLVTILKDCRACALIAEERQADFYRILQQDAPFVKILIHNDHQNNIDAFEPTVGLVAFSEVLKTKCEQNPPKRNIDLDLACLVYTSGSTGESKGVMSDHSNVDFATEAIITYLENTSDDIVLNCLPLSFDYGLYQLLMVFKFGGTLVLEKRFVFPAAILKTMVAEHVTGFPGVPTIFSILLNTDLSNYDLSSLRYLTNTAAALPVSHIERLRDTFPTAALYSMYGLTETKRTLYLPPAELNRRPDSVGIAIPGTEVWLEDETGNRLGAGKIGELVVRGRHVMRGYWNDPEATAERYRPGPIPNERVCYTGDLFRMDDEGFYYFVSRKDDIIKTRGEKVSPVELERVLYGIDGVIKAAVIGVGDEVLGQAIKAFIVSENAALTPAKVLAYCRDHVEDYMIPKYVEFRQELRMSESGKILKTELS